MSLLGRIAKLDSAMQRGLDNSFAAVFGGRIVPAEIEDLLKQEADDNAVRTYEGTMEAPNLFTVRVSAKDFSNLSTQFPDLAQQLAGQMQRYIRNKQWHVAGPVAVQIQQTEELSTGQLKANSHTTERSYPSGFDGAEKVDTPQVHAPTSAMEQVAADAGSEPTQWSAAPAPARENNHVNLLIQDGSSRTYMVHDGSNIIGRSADSDLQLPDTGVSRHHAEIVWDGDDAILVDLESTNGTVVNNRPVENWMLADGDVIQIGHSLIEVRFTRG
ncbi:MAG: DUF3662 and FHA domain-containing protein [Corynebacterium sp.]|nr:DUF3662 and FHA domain-containing protein [Corynebacterium sp.]